MAQLGLETPMRFLFQPLRVPSEAPDNWIGTVGASDSLPVPWINSGPYCTAPL
jgi:hypothetical protein